jgi:hypothetical protein
VTIRWLDVAAEIIQGEDAMIRQFFRWLVKWKSLVALG